MRHRTLILAVFATMATVLLAGPAGVVSAREGSLQGEYRSAAQKYGVPLGLLKAMGYTNTRWEMPPPSSSDYEKGSTEGRGEYGIMALTQNPSQNTLKEASELTGIPQQRLKRDRAANIEGAAAVLSEMAGEKPSGINGWFEVVSEYGGGPVYAEQVYLTLKDGASEEISTGERVTLKANPEAQPNQVRTASAASADYGRATWYGAYWHNKKKGGDCSYQTNYCKSNRPDSLKVNRVVIHVTQGSWSSAINWFKDSRAGTSAHYTIRSDDGKIGQSVRERNIAYHAGNWNYNQHSIGIEHEGYVSQKKWFTDRMYRSSARLTAHLAKKYNIPIDRKHIVGHNEVPGADHTDPGRYWNWKKYMNYVRSYAAYQQVVDNNWKRFSATSNWKSSSWSSQKYGKNYRYSYANRPVSQAATFSMRVPKTARYKVFVRYPADSGYNPATHVRIRTAGGWAHREINQRKNGGKWVRVATVKMAQGNGRRVQIYGGRKGAGYIIADAVKIRSAY